MPRTRIKFCGVTRPQDAAAAASAGADAIGLVFCSTSPRAVTITQANQIIAAVPPFVTPVGLFVDSPAQEILDVAGQLGLGHIQLHGHETSELVEKLRHLKVIKMFHVEHFGPSGQLSLWKAAVADRRLQNLVAILLETANTSAPGGTGIENDWNAIATAQKAGVFADLPPLIVAGGLTPENVGKVVRMLHPYAVDVSSGIEIARGVKSEEKMVAFVQAVREAEYSA